jgi:hypothetical protein
MGKHRRHEIDVLLAAQQYEQLVSVLCHHRPAERSGLCLVCGTGWPCVEVWLPLEHRRVSGELGERDIRGTARNGDR